MVLCCWKKAEGRGVGGSAPHAHQIGHCPGISSQTPTKGWGRGICSFMPPICRGSPSPPGKEPCKISLTSALVFTKEKKLRQLLLSPATQPHASSSPPFLSSPQQSVTPRAHLHLFPSSREKAIPNPGGCCVLTGETGAVGMSPAPIGQGVSSARSCLAEGVGSRWALLRGAVGAGVTFPAPGDSQPLPAPELLQSLPCWIAPENRDAPLEEDPVLFTTGMFSGASCRQGAPAPPQASRGP